MALSCAAWTRNATMRALNGVLVWNACGVRAVDGCPLAWCCAVMPLRYGTYPAITPCIFGSVVITTTLFYVPDFGWVPRYLCYGLPVWPRVCCVGSRYVWFRVLRGLVFLAYTFNMPAQQHLPRSCGICSYVLTEEVESIEGVGITCMQPSSSATTSTPAAALPLHIISRILVRCGRPCCACTIQSISVLREEGEGG